MRTPDSIDYPVSIKCALEFGADIAGTAQYLR